MTHRTTRTLHAAGWASFALLVGVSLPCIAAENWKRIHVNPRGDSLWIDLASVRREGDRVWYSDRMDFASPLEFASGTQVKTIWANYIIDCAKKTRAMLGFRGLTPSGEHVGQADPITDPKFAPENQDPESPDAIGFNYVCSLPSGS
jgi:hypothetical protein